MQTATNARIVDAGPEQAAFIAWVMLISHRSHLARGFWDFIAGGDEAEKLRYLEAMASTSERHWAHYSNFLVAEIEGKPVSALCGYFDEEMGGARLRLGILEVNARTGRTEEDDAAGWERAKSIMNVLPEHVPGAWIVEHVATLPEFRRRGLVDRLLAEILERGRRRGATVADISVLIGNDAAQRAYEKCGFRVIAEKLDPEFEAAYKTPGIRTLRRSL